MPTGAQDLTATEDGSYFLNGAMSDAELVAVTRKTAAQGMDSLTLLSQSQVGRLTPRRSK